MRYLKLCTTSSYYARISGLRKSSSNKNRWISRSNIFSLCLWLLMMVSIKKLPTLSTLSSSHNLIILRFPIWELIMSLLKSKSLLKFSKKRRTILSDWEITTKASKIQKKSESSILDKLSRVSITTILSMMNIANGKLIALSWRILRKLTF